MAHFNLNSTSPQMIYIYAGPGTSSVAIKHTKYTLKQFGHPQYTTHTIGPEEVVTGTWTKDAALVIMPGGADILYARTLKGMGNQQIQSFVQGGGRYLGFCAGAYYGSQRLLFAKGTTREVTSDRELAFFPDIAQGPTLKPWDPKTNAGADAALVQWAGPHNSFSKNHIFTTYYNGGGHFVNANAYPQVTVLANYATPSPPKAAIIEISVGKGRVILSGVHCEFAPELFDMTDPFLIPVQKQLIPTDQDRRALMVHLLNRLDIETRSL